MDYYICCDSEDVLRSFLSGFLNVIGPQPGRLATAEQITEDGLTIPATESVGDPAKWYACLRTDETIDLPETINFCAPELGSALCGVWA